MNYLAHAYLSFRHPEILVGNMISDFVKGKKQYDYPLRVQKGIRLHRAIDEFTDNHPATREAKILLKPTAGAYAGAFIDVVYDHFLALDTREMVAEEWLLFTTETYLQLSEQTDILPEKFAQMLPYMTKQNWLYNYRYKEGIQKSFGGLVRRAAYLDESMPTYELFLQQYKTLEQLYQSFFPEVKAFASSQFRTVLS